MGNVVERQMIAGSLGQDKEGRLYKEMMAAEGVVGFYEYFPEPTAQCLVLVNGSNRSLVTRIGAANYLTSNIFHNDDCNTALQSATIFYLAGFSLSLNYEVVQRFVEASKNKTLILNLSAPFVCERFCDIIYQLIAQADYVFGNESEVKGFAVARGLGSVEDEEAAAKYFAKELFMKNSKQTLIVTRGDKSLFVVTQNTFQDIKVPKVNVRGIKDTNGAGDAFVGGFLCKLAEEKSEKECIEYGIAAAQSVLTQIGCRLPESFC